MHLQTTDLQRPAQIKHAISALAKDAYFLVANKPAVARRLFMELLEDIGRVVYYKPKRRRKAYSRISKPAVNKWREVREGVVRVA